MKEVNILTKLYEKQFIKNPRKIPVKITSDSNGIYISPKGYGDACTSKDGIPIMLELYGDELRLVVWADIMSEDPTHIINLEGAREDSPERIKEMQKELDSVKK